MSGLQLMVESYTKNPSYGDANKFRGELDKVTHRVQLLESDLFSLNTELRETIARLGRDSTDPHQETETVSLCESESHSSGYPSSASSVEVGELESQYGGSVGSYRTTIQSLLNTSPALYLPDTNPHLPDEVDGEDLPLPPPPPDLLDQPDLVTALYHFDVMTEGNIDMREGEEFYRLGQDEEGWMKVRRLDGTEEGFVPTSFLRI